VRGAFVQAGKAGANRFHFTGRIAGHKLRPGRYELDAYAVDDQTGKASPAARAAFTIVP